MSEEKISSSKEFKEVFSYIFREEADARTAIPITGVMRLGSGWSFIISDFYKLYTKYSVIDEKTGSIVPDVDKILAPLQSIDEEKRQEAFYFLRWMIILEKYLPILLSLSPRAHEIARRLVDKVSVPEIRYQIVKNVQSRTPFWSEYVGVEKSQLKG